MTESAFEIEAPSAGEVIAEIENALYVYRGSRTRPSREIGPVSLRVRAGERVALIGPNGCGKSTLIHLLSGASTPAAGSVRWFEGVAPAHARRRIGVVFQSPALDDLLTVRETLRLAGRLLLLPAERIERRLAALVESMGLADRATDRVGTLSGGLKRRVDLARAIMHEPELLLLDEPTAGLDVDSAEAFNDSLQSLGQAGVAVVSATHTLSEVEAADRVVVMSAGRIVLDDRAHAPAGGGGVHEGALITGQGDMLAQSLAALGLPQIDGSTWCLDAASLPDETVAAAVRAAIDAGGQVSARAGHAPMAREDLP